MLSCCRALGAVVEDAIEDRRLSSCDDKKLDRFVPAVTRGKVVAIYDGDTITVAARHLRRGRPYLFSVRLAGIDSPEIRGKSEKEKEAARASRDFLREQILGKFVTLSSVKTEKYGRLLATVLYRGRDVNQLMVDRNYAVPYDGGKKPTFVDPDQV